MQWIFVLCGCMFLLSLRATYQAWTVSLKAGLYTYNALEPTASSFGSAALRLRFRRRLTAGVRRAERFHPNRRDDIMPEGVESETYFQWLSQAAPHIQLHHLMS